MGRRRASIDWCPASPPCTHTHIDSPFLPCRATLFFQPSSTFFLPRFPIFQPRVIPFLLFHFARPSYFSFGREPRFSALRLSPTSVFAWNRRFYASCIPQSLSVLLFLVLASFPNVVPLLSTDVERPIFSLICYQFQVSQYIQNFYFRESDTLSVSSFSFDEHSQV